MPTERYYFAGELSVNHSISLKETEHHHLVRVMRTQLGDQIELVNGEGVLAQATVQAIEKQRTELLIISVERALKPTEVILVQALPKMPRLDWIVEKGTELGVTQLWLFAGQKSEKKELNAHQQERLKAILISAMKQSGRLFLPLLRWMPPLAQWKEPLMSCAFYGDPSPQAPLLKQAWNATAACQKGVSFFVGPESGWSQSELQRFQELSVKPVRLHPYVLRTETAGLAALALIQHWLME